MECSKRFVRSCPESLEGKAAASWTGGAYEPVREHGQGATCLREATPAKAGNALADFFNTPNKENNP